MKIITASTLGIAFLFVISFLFLKPSEASVGSYSEITRPTPPSNKAIKEVSSPTPTPAESPQYERDTPVVDELSIDSVVLDPNGDFDCDGVSNHIDNCPWVYIQIRKTVMATVLGMHA